MHVSITRSACDTRLYVSLSGPIGYADRARALEMACDAGRDFGITRFLIDFTLSWQLLGVPGEKAAFFQALGERSDLVGTRIAYLNCPEGSVSELNAAARQVGFTVAMFQDRSTAIDWLRTGAHASTRAPRPRAFGARRGDANVAGRPRPGACVHSIDVLPEDPRAIEVRYTGDVTDGERLATLIEALGFVAGRAPVVLADFTHATMLCDDPGSRIEYTSLVNRMPDLRNGRLAMVNARSMQATDHLQALATARAFRYRHFDNRDDAVRWLLGD